MPTQQQLDNIFAYADSEEVNGTIEVDELYYLLSERFDYTSLESA